MEDFFPIRGLTASSYLKHIAVTAIKLIAMQQKLRNELFWQLFECSETTCARRVCGQGE